MGHASLSPDSFWIEYRHGTYKTLIQIPQQTLNSRIPCENRKLNVGYQ